MQKDLVERDETTSVVVQEQQKLHQSYAEQEDIIEDLRQQLRNSQKVVSLYEDSNSRKDVFDDVIDNEGLGTRTRGVVHCHDISFEIEQASKSGILSQNQVISLKIRYFISKSVIYLKTRYFLSKSSHFQTPMLSPLTGGNPEQF